MFVKHVFFLAIWLGYEHWNKSFQWLSIVSDETQTVLALPLPFKKNGSSDMKAHLHMSNFYFKSSGVGLSFSLPRVLINKRMFMSWFLYWSHAHELKYLSDGYNVQHSCTWQYWWCHWTTLDHIIFLWSRNNPIGLSIFQDEFKEGDKDLKDLCITWTP